MAQEFKLLFILVSTPFGFVTGELDWILWWTFQLFVQIESIWRSCCDHFHHQNNPIIQKEAYLRHSTYIIFVVKLVG